VGRSLFQMFERWDGRGAPLKLREDAISLPARIAQLATQSTVFHRLGGAGAAVEVARRRAGTTLDPSLVEVFARHAEDLLHEIDSGDPWHAVVEAEPAPQRRIPETRLDDVARAFADVVDLKSPHAMGHSREVAGLAEAAGGALGLPGQDIVSLRRAGLFHDLGRVSVTNGVWEKPGPLTTAEWEQVRLHPYHTERILSRSAALSPLAALAGMHHERLDGSGYHRQITAGSIPMPARVLAAADEFHGLTQPRPHRPALDPPAAADRLLTEVREGRLDARAVDAVLSAAGQDRPGAARAGWPAGLTEREVEVLGHLARGLSNRDIGRNLFISPKTVGRHVEHIYEKLGVSSRAAAAMFAARHHLLH
jgi:HD-GYP domain-containing protein (c-di-GMP phosphodiesterase class II)